MALTAFAPTLWAAETFVRLRKALVHGAIANREYEGQLVLGDRIKINEVSAVDTGDYTKRTDITWQEPDAAQKILYIDQATYSAVDLEDIERVQSRADLRSALESEMAYALADTVDQHLAGLYTEAGGSVSAATITAGNVLQNITNFMEVFDDNNNPGSEPRFMPIPPFYHKYVLQAATGIIGHTGVPKVMDNGLVINGMVGEILGMNLLLSNNVNGTFNMMALTRRALYHVMQITEMEVIRRENRFANGMRTLLVYGSKVVRPNAMVSCTVTEG